MEVEPKAKTESQRARVTLQVQRAKEKLTAHVTDPVTRPTADKGRAGRKEEPGGVRGMEGQGEAGGVTSRGRGRSMTD